MDFGDEPTPPLLRRRRPVRRAVQLKLGPQPLVQRRVRAGLVRRRAAARVRRRARGRLLGRARVALEPLPGRRVYLLELLAYLQHEARVVYVVLLVAVFRARVGRHAARLRTGRVGRYKKNWKSFKNIF